MLWASQIRRRLAAALAAVVCSVFVCFLLAQLTPGDAFTRLELDPSVSPAVVAALRARYLPQHTLLARFALWTWGALHGDLGYSLDFHRPVLSLLAERLPASLELMLLGVLIAWILGLVLAMVPAWFGESSHARLERLTGGGFNLLMAVLAALPIGLIAVLALMGVPASWQRFNAGIGLPALVLALGFLPLVYFQSSHALAAIRERPFVAHARAGGMEPLRLLFGHALPNTADILVPAASLTISQAIVELVVVETLLAWPGVGQLALQAAEGRDLPLLASLVLVTSVTVVVANLFSDGIQFLLNPRLRWNSDADVPFDVPLATRGAAATGRSPR